MQTKNYIIEIEKLGEIDTNSYLIYPKNEELKKCFIVDLGEYPEKFNKLIKEKELELEFIIFTHGHYDHLYKLDIIYDQYKPTILISDNDRECITDIRKNFSNYSSNPFQYDVPYKTVNKNSKISFNGTKLEIFETPGHTVGSICILFDKALFSGDTIFSQSIGRTDLPGGSYKAIMESIDSVLSKIPNETLILPGHGESTTAKIEKENNPFIIRHKSLS